MLIWFDWAWSLGLTVGVKSSSNDPLSFRVSCTRGSTWYIQGLSRVISTQELASNHVELFATLTFLEMWVLTMRCPESEHGSKHTSAHL